MKSQWRGLSSWDFWMNIWSKSQIPKIKMNTINICVKWKGKSNFQNIWKLFRLSRNFALELLLFHKKTKSMKWSFLSICVNRSICKNLHANLLQVKTERLDTVGKSQIPLEKFDTIKTKVILKLSLEGSPCQVVDVAFHPDTYIFASRKEFQ